MASWRSLQLGQTLHRQRTLAGVAVHDLATRLIAARFCPDELNDTSGKTDASAFVTFLDAVEAGGQWPLDDRRLQEFLNAAAGCLAHGHSGHRQSILRRLVQAAAYDMAFNDP